MPRVLLLPGLMGTGELKREALIRAGYDVRTVAFSDDAAASWPSLFKAPLRNLFPIVFMLKQSRQIYAKWVEEAQAEYDSFQPDIVVGASRGGSVAMTMQIADNVPILLLAPAYKWFGWIGGSTSIGHPHVAVVHSRQDETIPFAESEELCRRCPQVKLIAAGADHSLNTPDAIAICLQEVDRLTRRDP